MSEFLLIAIVILFTILVLLQKYFPKIPCPLCISVSTTWVIGLFLYYSGFRVSPILLGVLMGGSIVGLMYFFANKLGETSQIFKMPFLVTFVLVFWGLIEGIEVINNTTLSTIGIIWLITLVVYNLRDSKRIKPIFKKLVECCKNW